MIKTIDCGQNKEKIYASDQMYEKMKASLILCADVYFSKGRVAKN